MANAVAAVVVGLAVALAELGATLEAAEMVAAAAPAVEVGLAVADAPAEAETEASPVGVCAAAAETNSATNTTLRLKNNNTLLTLSTPFARTFPYGTILMGQSLWDNCAVVYDSSQPVASRGVIHRSA